MKHIDINEIMRAIPHRYPMLLIDRIIDYVPMERVTAIKNVTCNEPQFVGHFPHRPVMSGVLIVEAMAQATGVLAHLSFENYAQQAGGNYYLACIDKCRFRSPVQPGDTVTIEGKVLRPPKNHIWKFYNTAHVGERLIASAYITCAARA